MPIPIPKFGSKTAIGAETAFLRILRMTPSEHGYGCLGGHLGHMAWLDGTLGLIGLL